MPTVSKCSNINVKLSGIQNLKTAFKSTEGCFTLRKGQIH